MPPWLAVVMGLLGLYQTSQQSSAYSQALSTAAGGGMSDEEWSALREQGEASLYTDLSRRGLLDSGLLPGGRAALEGELALAKAKAKLPFQQSFINMLLAKSQQPTMLGSLVPLIMQYGIKGWFPGMGAPPLVTPTTTSP